MSSTIVHVLGNTPGAATTPAADDKDIRPFLKRERERGYAVTLDAEFAEAVEEVVRNRKPWNPTSWD